MRRIYLLFMIIISLQLTISQRNRKKQKFLRLPSGLTIPADAASNFQRDAYIPATFAPPNEKILNSPPRYIADDNGGASYPASNTDSSGPSPQNVPTDPGEGMRAIPSNGMDYKKMQEIVDAYIQSTPPSAAVSTAPATIPPMTSVSPPAMPTTPSSADMGTTPATMGLKKGDVGNVAQNIQNRVSGYDVDKQQQLKGHTYTALGSGQFYQSILGGKNGFSPLSFFLNNGLGGAVGGGAGNNGFFVPVPIVIPPPPPPPPGPKCFTNPSGFLCCNVTLERVIEEAYISAKSEGISSCNVQKMASAVQEKAEKKFGTSFESIAAHKDFVAKINFGGDLNCKVEIDGKFILAYATPQSEEDVNIVDASSFFSGAADKELEGVNGTKPTYIVYGPIK